MATQKFYQDMSTEEQLQWVQGFSEVLNKGGERIAVLAKDSRAVWTRDDQAMMQRLFGLLACIYRKGKGGAGRRSGDDGQHG